MNGIINNGETLEKNFELKTDKTTVANFLSLLKYLKEASVVKNKTIFNINNEEWKYSFNDIKSNKWIKIWNGGAFEESYQGSRILLSVDKPDLEIDPKDSKEKNEAREYTRNLFYKLHALNAQIERESESYELLIGAGVLFENDFFKAEIKSEEKICYPVLVRKAKIAFDAEKNIIYLLDTINSSEIETSTFSFIDGLELSAVGKAQIELDKEDIHPLDKKRAPEFLKNFLKNLVSTSKFLEAKRNIVNKDDKILMNYEPILFLRKKKIGVTEMVDQITRLVRGGAPIPKHLVELLEGGRASRMSYDENETVEEELANMFGESERILLTKSVNTEQLQIAKRIENYNSVLVQGPPGTGKTHTIANLLGHFLAQGKNVLVTSHTQKALSVLKEKVPKGIKNLCVAVLDDELPDMQTSVEGIEDMTATHTAKQMYETATELEGERVNLLHEVALLRKKLYDLKCHEYDEIIYEGEHMSLLEIAEFVGANEGKWIDIPGEIPIAAEFPLKDREVIELYETNESLDVDLESELANGLLNIRNVLKPEAFKQIVNEFNAIKNRIENRVRNANLDGANSIAYYKMQSAPEFYLLDALYEGLKDKLEITNWRIQCIADSIKGGGYKAKWIKFFEALEELNALADKLAAELLGKKIVCLTKLPKDVIVENVQKIGEYYKTAGKIPFFTILFNAKLKEVYNAIKINGQKIASEEDAKKVLDYLMLESKREYFGTFWTDLITKSGGVEFKDLGEEPERVAMEEAKNIKRAMNWYDYDYKKIEGLIEAVGADFSKELFSAETLSDVSGVRTEFKFLYETLLIHLDNLHDLKELENKQKEINNEYEKIQTLERRDSKLFVKLGEAMANFDCAKYEEVYQKMHDVSRKSIPYRRRQDLLTKLTSVAPSWGEAVRNRVGIHGKGVAPKELREAWKYKQLSIIIHKATSQMDENLYDKIKAKSEVLDSYTKELVKKKAWWHLLHRTERNLSIKQALVAWKVTMNKLGKGHGKNASFHLKEARKLMGECQQGVPAWIMTVEKAMKILDPSKNKFDVLIIDEASQSDVTALPLLFLAKRVIIVGDDQQVSPADVGSDSNKVQTLIDMYIKDKIKNWNLYELTSSLYTLAEGTYKALILKEHFRSVPDIIGFSNWMCYNYGIKTLREADSTCLRPAVVEYKVNGKRGPKRTNEVEAKAIVNIIKKCLNKKEYNGMTFGVISMIGEEQSRLIERKIFEEIPLTEIKARRIICGNSAQFQGDERDVMLLSIIDSNEKDRPLPLRSDGPRNMFRERYNVAASRAKNQMWVVHSLDIDKDLKDGDIRKMLIEYAKNPNKYKKGYHTELKEKRTKFEREVFDFLKDKGYDVRAKWPVGTYRIDIVVCDGAKKLAIECEGTDYALRRSQVKRNFEKQSVLERLGWVFARIRGINYYLAKEKTLNNLLDELNERGINPKKE